MTVALRALIFDLDGTLAETEEAHRQAFNATFAAHGLDWDWDVPLYGELLRVAGGKERIAHYVHHHRPELVDQFPWERVATLHAEKTPRYLEMVAARGVPLRPGVERLLRAARADGLKLAIATTTSRPNVAALLDSTLGGAGLFDVIGCGEDAEAKKPDPAVYRVVLERLGLPAADCLAIEDSVIGLRSAGGAGIATVITRSAYGLDDVYDGALAVLDSLESVTLDDLRGWHGRAGA